MKQNYASSLKISRKGGRAVAGSENPGVLVVMGGDNVPTLVEIG